MKRRGKREKISQKKWLVPPVREKKKKSKIQRDPENKRVKHRRRRTCPETLKLNRDL